MRRRVVLLSVLGLIAVSAVLVWWLTRPLPVLTVATWAGPYARAQANAMFRPFGEAARVNVRLAEYDGGIEGVRAQVTSGHYDWDVVDFELDDAVLACEEGLLEPIDAGTLPAGANGAPASRDFVPGAIGKCWTGSVVFSQVIVYSQSRFGAARPQTLSDFFDLKRFPGQRALRRASGKYNLELALLADGVPPKDVYALLATPQGVARALAKLDTIRGALVWWTRSDNAVRMVEDGRAAFATALNGDVYEAQRRHEPVGVIWDRQLYELDVFGVPKGDPNSERAMDFIRFATGSKPLARVADWVPYGPARRSSLAFVGRNPDLGIAMTPYLPTAKVNFASAFAVDDGWWRRHGDDIAPRWQSWLASGQ